MGFSDIHSARNGREAFDMVAQHGIGLVLADWHMPEMTGIDLLRALRTEDSTRDLPVTLITGKDRESMVRDAIQANPSAYIIKPYSIATIEA